MTAIWKFTMTGSECAILMPRSARLLTVGAQEDDIVIWAEVDPAALFRERRFQAFNTGAELPKLVELPLPAPWVGTYNSREYQGTVQMPGGVVWHVYEIRAAPAT